MTAQAMMRVKYKRPVGWNQMGQKAVQDQKEILTRRLIMGLSDMHKSILETPVYTGSTLANYRWSLGAPADGVRQPVKEPALPGKTSDKTLGSEPRRRANEELITQEFEQLISEIRQNPFQDIFLVNNKPNFSDIEYGTYASAGKGNRTPPGGMTRRGETLLEYDMMGYLKRVA